MIEITGVPAADVANLKVACAKITGAATGTANLADWVVKVYGEALPLAAVRISNGILKAAVVKGSVILVR